MPCSELVIQPGYTLSSAEVKFAGGQAAAATAPAAATAATSTVASLGEKKKKNKNTKKKSDKVPAVSPAAAAVGSTPAPLQTAGNRHSQTAEMVLAGGSEQGAAAAGERNTAAAVSRVRSSGAAPAASPASNRRSPDAENMQRGRMAAAAVTGTGHNGSSGGDKGDEGLGQSTRPRRQSLSRLSLRQRNAKSPAPANSQKGLAQARAWSSMSLDRTSAASPRRDGGQSPTRDATLHTPRDCTGSDGGATLSPSPPSASATAAATVVDLTAISSTPGNVKRKIAVDSKSPACAPPQKVQARG